MSTRNPSPDVPPDVASLVTVVNFSVTMSGLEGQLLGVTIQHEKPELERQKSTLLAAEDELKIQLEGMEQKLLADLASSEGNILETNPNPNPHPGPHPSPSPHSNPSPSPNPNPNPHPHPHPHQVDLLEQDVYEYVSGLWNQEVLDRYVSK